MRKRVIITKSDDKSIENYAERCSADYIQTNGSFFYIKSIAESYNRILWIGPCMCINLKTPNLFDMHPTGLGLVRDEISLEDKNNIYKLSLKMGEWHWGSILYDTNVVLMSNYHLDLLERAKYNDIWDGDKRYLINFYFQVYEPVILSLSYHWNLNDWNKERFQVSDKEGYIIYK